MTPKLPPAPKSELHDSHYSGIVQAMPEEFEQCWCVPPPDPERVLGTLSEQELLGGLRLGPLRPASIEDRILDRDDLALAARGLTLRLRRLDGETLLTVKGPSSVDAAGAVRRAEWEAPWSLAAAQRALAALEALGGPPLGSIERLDEDVLTTLGRLGLVTVQTRRTERLRRTLRDRAGRELAELALDSVQFDFRSRVVRHHEIELELLPGGDPTAFAEAAQALSEEWGSRLVAWPLSKTALGAALERRTADGRSEGMFDALGRPTRDAYVQLAAELVS